MCHTGTNQFSQRRVSVSRLIEDKDVSPHNAVITAFESVQMSLKFGVYLVEQRIVTPEQFCGLVKIQQEATKTLASLAVSQNFLTIRTVTRILEIQEVNPHKTFCQIAVEEQLLDRTDADLLLQAQQKSGASIRRLVVECGLLTERQCAVLFLHFGRRNGKTNQRKRTATPAKTAPTHTPVKPRTPKFKQRPVIVSQLTK